MFKTNRIILLFYFLKFSHYNISYSGRRKFFTLIISEISGRLQTIDLVYKEDLLSKMLIHQVLGF